MARKKIKGLHVVGTNGREHKIVKKFAQQGRQGALAEQGWEGENRGFFSILLMA